MNMAYCRCRNTLADLRDVYEHVQDIDELSAEEALAMRRIVRLCKRIAEDFEGEESL